MLSSLVFPLHDPHGTHSALLAQILPILKQHFAQAFVVVTTPTRDQVAALQADPFFRIVFSPDQSPIGDHFFQVFQMALDQVADDHILHLCTPDRLAFALLTEYQAAFLADMQVRAEDLPILFARSKAAWLTHPQNYWAAETLGTQAGEMLFGKTLDFFWCHITLTARQLRQIMPDIYAPDLVIFTKVVLALRDRITMHAVDWLAWEDPLVLGRDAAELKYEREHDPNENAKRLGYVLPSIEVLFEAARLTHIEHEGRG
jgi:hypothetical protein